MFAVMELVVQIQHPKMNKNQNGFTLIEILIVIAIIAMLLAVLIPNFNELRRKSRDQNRKTGVKAYVEALELYKLNQNPPAYPVSINVTPGQSWEHNSVTYLNKTPKDPLYTNNPNQYFYRYSINGDSLRYFIGVCLEDASDPEGQDSPDIAILKPESCPSKKWYYKTEP